MTSARGAGAEFSEAFDRCFLAGYQAAYRIVGERADAEDIAQESMTRAYIRWGAISGYSEPWVVRVAINIALDAVRRKKRRPSVPSGGRVDETDIDARLDLSRAIARLPKRQREVVALRYVADLSEADVMELLGCSAGTVKQHAHRGLNALRSSGHLLVEES
jgi:RNA polymerase sigma factor (sigma-70 family)